MSIVVKFVLLPSPKDNVNFANIPPSSLIFKDLSAFPKNCVVKFCPVDFGFKIMSKTEFEKSGDDCSELIKTRLRMTLFDKLCNYKSSIKDSTRI